MEPVNLNVKRLFTDHRPEFVRLLEMDYKSIELEMKNLIMEKYSYMEMFPKPDSVEDVAALIDSMNPPNIDELIKQPSPFHELVYLDRGWWFRAGWHWKGPSGTYTWARKVK